jgi:RNA polymerase subunit RPABC4/transcription elongation factor Spt4
MVWSCEQCGTILRLWKIKCPNCHKSAMSWLQIVVVAGLGLPAIFLLLRFL